MRLMISEHTSQKKTNQTNRRNVRHQNFINKNQESGMVIAKQN